MSVRRTALAAAVSAAILGLIMADASSGRAEGDGQAAAATSVQPPALPNPPSGQPGPRKNDTWVSWLSGTAAAIGETGQQAVSGAYYLGGEFVDSGRIIGVHTLRSLGVLETPGGIGRKSAQEEAIVGAWLETASERGAKGTQPAAASEGPSTPGTENTDTAALRSLIAALTQDNQTDAPTTGTKAAPMVDSDPVQEQGSADDATVTQISTATGDTVATTEAMTPEAKEEPPVTRTCDWGDPSDQSSTALTAQDIGIISGLGLMDEGPRRLSDGTVFLPKVTQRLLQVRTAVACDGQVAQTRRLVGHVIANPTSSGLVQAEQDGRVELGPFGFPVIGQRVERGELLAYLSPILSTREQAELNREIETLRGLIAAKELEIARTREMPLLPFRDGRILSLRLDLNNLRAQRDALIEGLHGRQPLVASVSGVIVDAHVRVGQVLEARHVMWEIAESNDLWVEAEMFGGGALNVVPGSSAVTSAGVELDLKFIGAGLATDAAQSSPVHFQVTSMPEGLRIGERVVVNLREGAQQSGTLIPRSALHRRTNGETIVWASFAPERFEELRVDWDPVDGRTVLVEAGLSPGMRVVVDGASMLSEVR